MTTSDERTAAERMAAIKATTEQATADAVFKGLSADASRYLARVFELSPGHTEAHSPGDGGTMICSCPPPADCPIDSVTWVDDPCRQLDVLLLKVRADRIRNAQKYQTYTPAPGFRLEILHDALILMVGGHIGSRDIWERLVKSLGADVDTVETALLEMKGLEAPAAFRWPHGNVHPRMKAPGTVCDGKGCGGKDDVDTESMLACFDSTYRAHVATDDIYAVARGGRHQGRAVVTVDGKGTSEFGAAIATIAYDKMGSHPSPTKVAATAQLIRGQARMVQAEAGINPTALPVRATTFGNGYLIDLGDEKYVQVDEDGWRVTEWQRGYPVMLACQRALPVPVKCTGPDPRLSHLGFDQADPNWHQIRMWQATAFFADHERQLMMLTGGSGSGKTKRAQSIAAIVDPLAEDAHGRPVLGGPLPDDEALAPELLRNYLFTSDNLTNLDEEDSDRLCRIATGYRFTRRVLYTTADTYSVVVLRAGLLTGIDVPPQLREDAQNRLLHLELDATATKRASGELDEERRVKGPEMFGALLDDMVTVLRAYRAGQYDQHDRFPIVGCAAQAFGPTYVASRAGHQRELARTRAEGDTMLAAVAMLVKHAGLVGHDGIPRIALTAAELFDAVKATCEDGRLPKMWSPNPGALKTRMGRNLATLAAFGITIEQKRTKAERWTELAYHADRQRADIPKPAPAGGFGTDAAGPFVGHAAQAHLTRVHASTKSRMTD